MQRRLTATVMSCTLISLIVFPSRCFVVFLSCRNGKISPKAAKRSNSTTVPYIFGTMMLIRTSYNLNVSLICFLCKFYCKIILFSFKLFLKNLCILCIKTTIKTHKYCIFIPFMYIFVYYAYFKQVNFVINISFIFLPFYSLICILTQIFELC